VLDKAHAVLHGAPAKAKETYYGGKRDLIQRQRRPAILSAPGACGAAAGAAAAPQLG